MKTNINQLEIIPQVDWCLSDCSR